MSENDTDAGEQSTHLKTSRRGFITKLKPSRKGFIASYPHFQYWKKTSVDDMAVSRPLNVYLHIPFCLQRCDYCYYKTSNMKGRGLMEQLDLYVAALCREIELASARFHLKQRPLVSIYMGGGTPTILSEAHLDRILATLHENLSVGNVEFTVEAEPVTMTGKKAEILKKMGVNRISMGVQSFSDAIIRLCGRIDTEEKALKAIHIARSTGAAVNIDLLSGLAGETMDSWAYTIDQAIATGVENITVYKMELYANTEYYKKVRAGVMNLPSDAQELEFMDFAQDRFEKAHYIPWTFFTFTREGRYGHVHTTSIWHGTDCYPFGASSHGCMGDWVFQNTNDVEKYTTSLSNGDLPINRGYAMTPLDKMIRAVVLGMKLCRLDLRNFQDAFGFRLESLCRPVIDNLEADGYVTATEDKIELTKKGILHGDYVGKSLGGYLLETCG